MAPWFIFKVQRTPQLVRLARLQFGFLVSFCWLLSRCLSRKRVERPAVSRQLPPLALLPSCCLVWFSRVRRVPDYHYKYIPLSLLCLNFSLRAYLCFTLAMTLERPFLRWQGHQEEVQTHSPWFGARFHFACSPHRNLPMSWRVANVGIRLRAVVTTSHAFLPPSLNIVLSSLNQQT